VDEAKSTIAQLDKVSANDYRTVAGAGVLLARYHLYDDAIQHFQAALAANPNSDEIKFDLADAYFRKGLYPQALDAAEQVSEQGRKDDAYLALLGISTGIWATRPARKRFTAMPSAVIQTTIRTTLRWH